MRRCLWEIFWRRRSARESFDVITCFDVLEHLYEPRRVMAKVGEWLKPGGIFYVLVPNVDAAEARVFGSYWHGLELPRHLFHYSPASLKFLAELGGAPGSFARNPAESRGGNQPALCVGRCFRRRGHPSNARGIPRGGGPSLESGAQSGSHDCFARCAGDGSPSGRRRVHSCDFSEGNCRLRAW